MTNSFGAQEVRLAVRSSALSEDGSASFAGQFLSELGVAREDMAESYKRVIASLFTLSATVYRVHQGFPLEDSGMAVACILEELGFTVTVRGDSLQSRFQKYDAAAIEDRLDQLGRLLQVTRQLDMHMGSDAAVVRFKEDFMAGIYR